MSNGVQDLRSLPLSDIIGAPVSAIVQAEAQAARTTLDFIEQVGFVKDPSAPAGTLGALRMVEFSYDKPDVNGQPAHFVTRVPLLALLPVPGVRIKTARVSFSAKITDVVSETTETSVSGSVSPSATLDPAEAAKPLPVAAMATKAPLQLRGGFSSSSKSSETTTGSYDLAISLDIEHVSGSPGLEKLLNVLDAAIADLQT